MTPSEAERVSLASAAAPMASLRAEHEQALLVLREMLAAEVARASAAAAAIAAQRKLSGGLADRLAVATTADRSLARFVDPTTLRLASSTASAAADTRRALGAATRDLHAIRGQLAAMVARGVAEETRARAQQRADAMEERCGALAAAHARAQREVSAARVALEAAFCDVRSGSAPPPPA
jgi:hypothetical protein